MNDIILTDKCDIQFNSSGDVATAKDIVGDSSAVYESIKQWIRHRILLDYQNGHPEMESLDLLVSEINTATTVSNVESIVAKYIEEAIMENDLIESCSVTVTRNDATLALYVNINYVISEQATVENIQTIWRL